MKTLLIAITAGAMLLTLYAAGLSFPLEDAIQPAAVCLGLGALALYWDAPNFRLCIKALATLVAFSTLFSVLIYGVGAIGRPLADDTLAACDSALGISAGAIIPWVNERPWLALAMKLVYFSAIPQTMLAIAYLGLTNNQALDRFLIRFMMAGLATAACFYFLPAIGTCASYDVPVPDYYQPIVRDLTALRAGAIKIVSWRMAEGLVTFPSFHAIWAVLLTLAMPRTRILNVLMILSTVTTGMHYATDVLGGLVICAIVVPLCDRWAKTCHEQSTKMGVVDLTSPDVELGFHCTGSGLWDRCG
jgi:membrane-associated phospholipid phosphatase